MNTKNSGVNTMRVVFGIIMILVYIGMGVLMYINFFNFKPIIAKLIGCLLIIYGVWRAYRQVHIEFVYEDVEDDESEKTLKN